MSLWYLIRWTNYVIELLSYGAIIPYAIVMIPCRAAYHLTRILTSPNLAKERPKIILAREPLPDTPIPLFKGYEDLEDYKYTPLQSDRHIRLLRLHSRNKQDRQGIECELLTVSLDYFLISHAYYAISYTWDDQKADRYILCEGRRLPVTKNCETILHQYRGCVLWIDAICIDQASDEKAVQVPLMCEIYKRASKVIIWLGDPALENGLIFNYLWLLWCCMFFPSPICDWLERKLYLYMMDRQHIDLVRDLIRRNWWQRVWTIQEAALAPQFGPFALRTTLVRCGTDEIPFDLLTGGLENLATYDALTDTYPFNHVIWTSYLVSHFQPRMQQRLRQLDKSAHIMISRNRACGVSDPKDRVYGTYGVFLECGLNLPLPSYSKSVDNIYWEFTVALCQQTRSLKVIELVSGVGASLDAPSWVPDFNEVWRAGDLRGLPTAAKNSQAEFHFSEHDTKLVASGKIVDIVHKNSNLTTWQPEGVGAKAQDGPLVNLEHGFERTIRAFRDWSRVLFEHSSINRYEDHETWLDTFGEALVQGMRVGLTTTVYPGALREALFTWIGWIVLLLTEETRAQGLAEVKEVPLIKETFYENPKLQHLTEIEEWQALCTLKTHPQTAQIHHAIWMLTRDKIFFVTVRGYMGTGPYSIQEKDVIVLLAGVDRPMVLRQVNEDPPRWRVVGPAYIVGMMKGELWEEESELTKFCLV